MDENFILREGSLVSKMTDQHKIVNIIDKNVDIEDIGSFVMGDMNSSIITFKMNRYYDGTDLSNKNINIFYKTSNGINKSEAYDIYISDDSLKFSWVIPYDLTLTKKAIAYICIFSDNYVWKTKTFNLSIDTSFDVSSNPSSTNWFLIIETGLETIKKKLSEIPNWARQPEKPTYTYEEVGALPNTTPIPSSLSDLSDDENHRTVSDVEKTEWSNKSDFSGSYNDLSDKPDNDLTNELKEKYDNTFTIANQNKENLKAKLDKSNQEPNKWLNTDSEGNISFSDKPSYTYNEVGAASANHNHDSLYASKNSEHFHENKLVLDKITSELIEEWSKHLTIRIENETLIIE